MTDAPEWAEANEHRNVPILRFPEFEGEWEETRGGDCFLSRRLKGEDGLPIYSVTLDRGMIRRDTLDRQMAADAADEKNLRALKNDLVYNMMRMWQGAVGIAPEICMVSPAYVVLSPKGQTHSDFFNQWFKSTKAIYKLWAYSHGLTSDRLRLYYNDFAQIPLTVPILSEQKKISVFLGAVDEKLAQLKHKRDLLFDHKRGVMQQIFSRKIRFKRDDGSDFPDWEEKRLGEVATFSKGQGVSKADIRTDGNTPCIRYAELYTIYGEVIDSVKSKISENDVSLVLSQPDDVIIPASGETALDIGAAACIKQAGVALGGDINIIRSSLNGEFLARYLTSHKRIDIARVAQGNSVAHLYSKQLKQITISIPLSDEQKKISDFLSAVDANIHAVDMQVAQMEAFKKGLLQQMFV